MANNTIQYNTIQPSKLDELYVSQFICAFSYRLNLYTSTDYAAIPFATACHVI